MNEKSEIIEISNVIISGKSKVLNTLQPLINKLIDTGYIVIGPKFKDNTISLGEISRDEELPSGYIDETEKAYYSLKPGNIKENFGYTVTPDSWKKFLFPPRTHIFNASKDNRELKIEYKNNNIKKYAFLGVKACELEAIKIQDRVFMNNEFTDTYYQRTRKESIIIGVNCSRTGKTCFCASMGTGPEFKEGYDILLTEVATDAIHYYIASSGSEKGNSFLNNITSGNAIDEQEDIISERMKSIRKSQIRSVDSIKAKESLPENFENPRFDSTAKRCFTCGNCTLVCPTCFCSTMEDTTDLKGENGQRWKKWDTCFNLVYSKVAGGNFRSSAKGRYRQWLTHKFSYWFEQFGTSGCVGCGRCITWCPAKIDVTEEVNHILNYPISNNP